MILTDFDLDFGSNSGMTTENTPVGLPAETDKDEQPSPESRSPVGDQAPLERTATAADEQAPGASESSNDDSTVPESAPEQVAEPEPVAASGQPESGSLTDTVPTEEVAGVPSSAANAPPPPVPSENKEASETSASPRRVQLNPISTPDALKPIPSLRPADPAPGVGPVATGSGEPSQATVGSGSDTSRVDESAEQPLAADSSAQIENEQAADESAAPPPPAAEPVAIPSKNESLDADLEAELEAAMAGSQEEPEVVAQNGEEAAESATAAATTPSPDMDVKRGTRLKGIVQSIHGDDMFVELGLRMAGVLSRRQFGLRKQPMQGEPLEVVVQRVDEKEGLIHVNLPTGTSKVRGDWDALVVDQNVECMVSGTNKGGLEVTVGSLRGFMPASQVELGYVPDLNVYVGQKLKARISEVNPKRRKLVLSRRSLLEEEREHSQQELFEKVQPGQQYTGRVKTLKDYGAFVDIGGADGLLHVAQISWTRINHPSEVLQEGQEVEVQILSVDKEKKKIGLGMRQLTQNPWKAAESKYTSGVQVKGKVTRIENFGAFIELEEGVEGLVHISELDHKRVKRVTEVLRVGQEVDVQVLEVDPKRKRVSLSVKALKEKPEEPSSSDESSPIKRQRSVDSLVGGIGEPTGGQLFGDPNKFGG